MIDPSDPNEGTALCGMCDGWLGTAAYVHADDTSSFLSVFCSEDCFRAGERAHRNRRWAARRRHARQLAVGTIFFGALVTPHEDLSRRRALPVALPTRPAQTVDYSALSPLPAGWFGPDWPPTDISLLASLGRDAWIHPMAGPLRRMPRTDSRVFGAARPGNRPAECRNGHCGVDLGGEIWGEHIRAVHDGVVDWVQRGANPDHGGRYVRLAHRNGTVFTQYFHLAAIPRGIERGMSVKGGDLVGLLGDTGVRDSGPHLHFTISVKPTGAATERYVDPEPFMLLWPLRIPVDGSEVGLVTTVAEPAVPLGSALLRPGNKRKLAANKKRARDEATRTETRRVSGTETGADTAASPDEEPIPLDDYPAPSEDIAPESMVEE